MKLNWVVLLLILNILLCHVNSMRILFLSLEFSAGTFSGNGVYAQAQVRSLSKLGHKLQVISGKPPNHAGELQTQGAEQLIEVLAQSRILTNITYCTVIRTDESMAQVEVSRWGKLDASAPWDEYASSAGDPDVVKQVQGFSPDVAMVVDWSALPAWHKLKPHLSPAVKLVYLNYRVFTRTSTGADLELVKG